ncbi:putative carboxylesterase nap [Legionella birminghamensis]|uniref:Carboxylesterase nap n=1 Tax=Legionella birminghamensis TaxID=28083 RepID=A0A378I9C8_9GAMM|nr:alpha/beta hydrolase [Legionella birminghamensis]KTC74848.1 putative carboxylesterase nap [Legionella birminghamensis]STX31749.1 Uncharacterized carboxylesterase nap [Legionella birminghamensis]
MTTQTAYKSDKARVKALASYAEILTQWPVPYEDHVVETSFGETYMIVSGAQEAKPLILLHGGGGNSTMFIDNVAALSKHFRIYAIDIIGEAGKSAGTRPSKITEYSIWLKEVLDALDISKAALCGASLGGTFAHQFALAFPQYVDSLILLAPPSLLKMRFSFIFRFILANMLPTTLFAKNFLHYMSSRGFEFPEQSVQAFVIQVQAYKLNTTKIPIISDYDLAHLPARTLLFIGEDEVLYDTEKVASRVRSVAPFVTIAIIAEAKHMVSVDQPDLVNERIIQFLS